eukprot:scaffold24801_cov181-Cylindrotheca_fusiformis.AAC.7
MKAKVAPSHKLLDIIKVVRTLSNDSTEPVNSPFKSPTSSSLTASSQRDPWRTKDESSIFRTRSTDSSEIPDMMCIQRCLAFDEDEED